MANSHLLVADPISPLGLEPLLTPDVTVDIRTGLTPAALQDIIGHYDALLVRSQTKVTADLLAAAPNLRIIGRAGVGVDNIDIEAATRRGILVVNAPDGNTLSACEHTFAMMLAAARHIPQAHGKLQAGHWDRRSFVGVELHGKTLGILGFGRIGREVAKRALAFGMSVIAFDPFLTSEGAAQAGVHKATVDEVIETSDFITLHTPLTKETRHLLSRDQFRRMKPNVRLINCARGGVIDEPALAEALQQGRVAAAALDVFEDEPLGPQSPLLGLPNCILTPHLGASTEEAQLRVAADVARDLLRFLQGLPVQNAVNPAVLQATDPS